MGKLKVYILDDHPLVREWLAGMIGLETDLAVSGSSGEMAVALAEIGRNVPDIVVVDLSLPRGSGLDFIKRARELHPSLRLMVLSMHDEASVAERALRAGAHGYVVKRDTATHIIEGIRAVAAGKFFVGASLVSQLTGRLLGGSLDGPRRPEDLLSDRELEVFRLRGMGRSAKEVATQLSVSVKTIGSYDTRIKEKLGLDSAGELTRAAVLWFEQQSQL